MAQVAPDIRWEERGEQRGGEERVVRDIRERVKGVGGGGGGGGKEEVVDVSYGDIISVKRDSSKRKIFSELLLLMSACLGPYKGEEVAVVCWLLA